MECKEFSFCGSFDCSDGSNRNIVECKEQDAYNSRQDHTSINRNIVECKEGRDIRGLTIEIVLIETSWNVKLYTTFYIVSIKSNNRNIVESKVIKV